MFVLNQILGTFIVHPELDATLQCGMRFLMFNAGLVLGDWLDFIPSFEGFDDGW